MIQIIGKGINKLIGASTLEQDNPKSNTEGTNNEVDPLGAALTPEQLERIKELISKPSEDAGSASDATTPQTKIRVSEEGKLQVSYDGDNWEDIDLPSVIVAHPTAGELSVMDIAGELSPNGHLKGEIDRAVDSANYANNVLGVNLLKHDLGHETIEQARATAFANLSEGNSLIRQVKELIGDHNVYPFVEADDKVELAMVVEEKIEGIGQSDDPEGIQAEEGELDELRSYMQIVQDSEEAKPEDKTFASDIVRSIDEYKAGGNTSRARRARLRDLIMHYLTTYVSMYLTDPQEGYRTIPDIVLGLQHITPLRDLTSILRTAVNILLEERGQMIDVNNRIVPLA